MYFRILVNNFLMLPNFFSFRSFPKLTFQLTLACHSVSAQMGLNYFWINIIISFTCLLMKNSFNFLQLRKYLIHSNSIRYFAKTLVHNKSSLIFNVSSIWSHPQKNVHNHCPPTCHLMSCFINYEMKNLDLNN